MRIPCGDSVFAGSRVMIARLLGMSILSIVVLREVITGFAGGFFGFASE